MHLNRADLARYSPGQFSVCAEWHSGGQAAAWVRHEPLQIETKGKRPVRLNRMPVCAPVLLLAFALSAGTITSFAAAQAAPTGLATAAVLSDAQKTELRDFVDRQKPLLVDREKIKTGRDAILAPLAQANVSVAFRNELWKAVSAPANDLIKSGDEVLAANGYRLAGEIATETSVEPLFNGLKSDKVAIRYIAAFGIRRAFEAATANAPAIGRDKAIDLLRALSTAAATEPDSHCLDAILQAIAAAGTELQQIERLRPDALRILCEVAGNKSRAMGNKVADSTTFEALIRAHTLIRDSFSKEQNPAWTDSAATLSGDVLAYAYRMIKSGELPSGKPNDAAEVIEARRAARRLPLALVAAAESTITLARQAKGASAATTSFADLLKRAETAIDANVLTDMEGLIGKDGKLISEFKIAPDRFPLK